MFLNFSCAVAIPGHAPSRRAGCGYVLPRPAPVIILLVIILVRWTPLEILRLLALLLTGA